MYELKTSITYLGLDKDTCLDTGDDGAVELRDMCGGVELVLVLGELVTDTSKQRVREPTASTNLLDSIARDALASGRIGGGNALLHNKS
jgi:hypothetical protein